MRRGIGLALCLLLFACGGESPDDGDNGAVANVEDDGILADLPIGTPDTAQADTANGGCAAAPCGGDVIGNWSFTRQCEAEVTPSEVPIQACPGMTNATVLYAEGGIEFRADGTLTVTKTLVQVTESFTPEVCSGANCELMNGFDECTAVTGGCDCTTVNQHETVIIDEPWSTDGTTLTSGAGDDEGEVEYCVAGDLLKMVHVETGEATFLSRD